MSFLKSALELADLGFHIFPLDINTKNQPIIKDYKNRATKDPEQIKKWWTNSATGEEIPYNIGISTSHYNCSQALLVVDVDNKNGKNGSDEALKLELQGHYFEPTFSQVTPTGGEHLVYKVPQAVKQGSDVLARGLDIRSQGGYIVGAGSVIDGKAYKIKSKHDISDCPNWIVNVCGVFSERIKKEVDTSKINEEKAAMRATHYLQKEAPIAIEGNGGDQTTFKVAARIKDLGVNEVQALELMLEHWNERCEPPWEISELTKKIENAFDYGLKSQGEDAAEVQFSPVKEDDKEEEFYLAKMNREYALIFGRAKHVVLHETVDEFGLPKRVYMTETSFKRKLSTQTVLIQQGKRTIEQTFAEVWLDWPGRREYNGITFAPEREAKNNYFNTWRGFTCKQTVYEKASKNAQQGFDAFLHHALNNICGGNKEHFHWLMNYFAHMFQKPYERPLTTLVFKGSKGTGKNSLVDRLGKILGDEHYLVADDSRYLTSNFNGHLESCLMLVLDEAFWSGDKKAEGKLKGLSTSPKILIERKGMEVHSVDNLVRMVIIGNEEWLVPASHDERRYAVFHVGEGNKGDKQFFKDMRVNLDEEGGNEILLSYFKNYPLDEMLVNDAPGTEELLHQKISSFDPLTEYIFDSLNQGFFDLGEFTVEKWQDRISRTNLKSGYERFCKKKNVRSWQLSATSFGRKLNSIFPYLSKESRVRDGELFVRSYDLGDLEKARKTFSQWIGQEITWG